MFIGKKRQLLKLYKELLRDNLEQVDLFNSLRVLWAHIQHLQFNSSFPNDIRIPPNIAFQNKIARGIFEWELITLAKEVIINSRESELLIKSFKDWDFFAKVVNNLKKFEIEIYQKFTRKKGNVLMELYRIAHRQFPWQLRPDKEYFVRYFKIFNHPALSNLVKNVIGLTTQELYLIGTLLFGFYLEKFSLFYPFNIEVAEISQENMDKFLNRFSCELNKLRKKLSDEQEINEKFAYAYNSLWAYPIIRMVYQNKTILACFSPTLLLWRMTAGVYYEICKEKEFGNAFGSSFQDYVGETLKAGNDRVDIYPEKSYRDGKDRKDTVDWIVDEGCSALFIECKTKRMNVSAKTEIKERALKKELALLSSFVVQAYKTIKDYRDNKYPNFKFKENRKVFPLIVTLENWFLFGDKSLDELEIKVKEKLKLSGLSLSWLSEMPYSICSIHDLEKIIQIMQEVGIKTFMTKKVNDLDKRKWEFMPFINNVFPGKVKELKFLFSDDFDKIFPERFLKRIREKESKRK